jgi:hypothetical protein
MSPLLQNLRVAGISAVAVACIAVAAPASANIVYDFSFKGLSNGDADFSLEVVSPTYLTTSGLAALPGALPTSLGYDVLNFGTNNIGWFGFSNSGGSLGDGGFGYSSTSFLYTPAVNHPGYITAPGVYAGDVNGNAPFAFSGSATLTVTDTSLTGSVPEPMTWTLMIAGFGLAGVALRRRRAAFAA